MEAGQPSWLFFLHSGNNRLYIYIYIYIYIERERERERNKANYPFLALFWRLIRPSDHLDLIYIYIYIHNTYECLYQCAPMF